MWLRLGLQMVHSMQSLLWNCPCQRLTGIWMVQVLYREQAAGMYTAMPFALAQCCVEIPWNLLQSILFSCVSYWMINFAHDAAKFFW